MITFYRIVSQSVMIASGAPRMLSFTIFLNQTILLWPTLKPMMPTCQGLSCPHELQVTFSDDRFFRLGKKSRDNKSPPIVICLLSETAVMSIFKHFNDENVPASLQGLSVSHDRTPRKRKHILEHLCTTLKARQEVGEKSLTKIFVNGTLSIVSKNYLPPATSSKP